MQLNQVHFRCLLNVTRCVRQLHASSKNTYAIPNVASTQTTSKDGTVIHSISVPGGAGIPILFIHGLYGNSSNFKSLMRKCYDQLKGDRTVISMDLRNHGLSGHSKDHTFDTMSEDVQAVLNDYGKHEGIIVGHSMGGRTTMATALLKPEIVNRALIVDIAPTVFNHLSKGHNDARRVGQIMSNTPVHQMNNRKLVNNELIEQGLVDASTRQFILQNLIKDENTGNFKWRVNLDVLNSEEADVHTFKLSGTPTPYDGKALFLYGTKSDFFKPGVHEPLVRAVFPRATFASLEAGHWLHAEKPDEFVSHVVKSFSCM
eukprot:m.113431 g.113431  ORF g.113431 m.113431 type:complete len:316 (-) comp14131_c0_seq7:555-1502(-)